MSDVDNKVKMIVEGLLMAAGRPLTLDSIIGVFSRGEKPDRKELKAVMDAIAADCDDRGFELKQVASGYRFQVKQDLSEWVAKLWEEKPPRYTRALLETLALIAYRQPITRGDIEDIRGVAVSPNIIRTLLDRDWVRVVGHRDVPGRPALFATTKVFLDYFNLKSLQELPPLSEIKEMVPSEPEIDLAEELAKQRVIELPDEESGDGEDGGDHDGDSEGDNTPSLTEREQLLAEEAALELAQKPLDEILGLGDHAANDDDESSAEEDEEIAEEEADEQGEEGEPIQLEQTADADKTETPNASEENLADELIESNKSDEPAVEPEQAEDAEPTDQSGQETEQDIDLDDGQEDSEQDSADDPDDEDILEFSTEEIEESSDR